MYGKHLFFRCPSLIGAASLVLSLGAEAHAQFCPADGVTLATGAPFTVRACDLNGDGHVDIVTANADTDNVSVLLNNGDGTFGAAKLYPAGDEPVDIDCCDVDGDGDLDLVTANRTPSQVNVLLNNGMSGGVLQLSAPTPYAVGLAPWGIRCTYLNADPRPDVVTSNFTGKSVSALLNNGSGTFAAHQDYLTGGNGTYDVAICDLDGDLDDDVVVTNLTSETITSFRNNGDGTLTRIGSYSTGTLVFPWGLDCCDLDGDGHPDVVTANGGDNTITVLFNDGTGRFDTRPIVHFTGANQPFKPTCRDIDGDGDNDVLTGNLGSDDVTVFTNSGNGTLTAVRSLPVGSNVGSVECADVDGDTDLDVLATSTTQVLLFPNQCAACTVQAQCNDSDLCTVDVCVSGFCEHVPKDCRDADSCTVDTCNATTGACMHTLVSCPAGQVCFEGSCQPQCSSNADCDDGVPCTRDVCQTVTGGSVCVHTPDDTLCDTGLFCAAEMCDMQLGCVPDDRCLTTSGNPCPDPASCEEDTNSCGGCFAPTVVAAGCRYLSVTPADQGSTPVALLVTGDCTDPNSACVYQYVQSKCTGGANNGQNCLTDVDCPKRCAGGLNPGVVCTTNGDCVLGTCAGKCEAGTLGSTPFYKPASQWGTAKVRGAQIRPGADYLVETQCDFPGVVLSAATKARTWKWGDIDGNGSVNALDIAQLVDAFKARVGSVPFEQANIWGCAPDKFIDALDITEDVDAFKGLAYPCSVVCP
jgi:hypothetical protein